jgi:hypothetical protein
VTCAEDHELISGFRVQVQSYGYLSRHSVTGYNCLASGHSASRQISVNAHFIISRRYAFEK